MILLKPGVIQKGEAKTMLKRIKEFLYCKKYNNEYVNKQVLSFSKHWDNIQSQQQVYTYLRNR